MRAGSAFSTFPQPISADDLGSSGLENRQERGSRQGVGVSVQYHQSKMRALVRLGTWRCTLLIKLRQIGRSWQPSVICFPGSHRASVGGMVFFLIRQRQGAQRTNNAPEIQPTVSEGRPACRDGFCISNEDISWHSAAESHNAERAFCRSVQSRPPCNNDTDAKRLRADGIRRRLAAVHFML